MSFLTRLINKNTSMYRILFVLLSLILLNGSVHAQDKFYSLQAKTIEGKDFSFESLKGKKVMIVNTASKCGLTPQYEQLEKLYATYKDSNFFILGFPSNDFLKQEPGTNEEIAVFCQKNYGVTFQMMEKITVKGKKMHPVYKYLTKKSLNGYGDSEVQWNFQKYLINEKGEIEHVISPRVSPLDPSVLEWITKKE